MIDAYICKIPLENLPGESISVYTGWTDNGFSIKVFYVDKAWDKSVSEDDLKSLCGFSQNSVEEYLLETKRALTCDGGCAEFTYSFTKSEFVWKKVVDSVQNIKVKFGSLLLDEMPVSSFAVTAVDILLSRCINLKTKNNSLLKENENLRAANTSLRAHVCSITKLKTEMEETLYNKSLAVLNAKKEKICELQQIIESRPSTSEIALDSGHKAKSVEREPASSKMNDLYGSDTELETDESSDLECPKRSSTLSTCTVKKNKEEDNELLPTRPKTQKLECASSNVTSVHLTKGPTERQDGDDIFVPARRKKNKGGVPRQ